MFIFEEDNKENIKKDKILEMFDIDPEHIFNALEVFTPTEVRSFFNKNGFPLTLITKHELRNHYDFYSSDTGIPSRFKTRPENCSTIFGRWYELSILVDWVPESKCRMCGLKFSSDSVTEFLSHIDNEHAKELLLEVEDTSVLNLAEGYFRRALKEKIKKEYYYDKIHMLFHDGNGTVIKNLDQRHKKWYVNLKKEQDYYAYRLIQDIVRSSKVFSSLLNSYSNEDYQGMSSRDEALFRSIHERARLARQKVISSKKNLIQDHKESEESEQ